MAIAFPDCYDCENASSINGELWCSLFFHPCSQTIACSRNAPKPEPKPISNADRIRPMSDEELAEWFSIYCCRNKTYDAHCETFGSCKACWFSWLQEEAKE